MQRASAVERYKFMELLHAHVGQMQDVDPSGGKAHKYYPSQIDTLARKLMRYGATLGRIAENQCNGYGKLDSWHTNTYQWDEQAAKRDELKEKRIQAKVTELCAAFGCKAVFQGDPRGNTLKIAVPDGYTNDWGREGIAVPTS